MKTEHIRYSILLAVILIIIGAVLYLQSQRVTIPELTADSSLNLIGRNADKASQYPEARELVAPAGFINSNEFTIQELIGEKVILLDIWTYSCINCQRTLPYITAWHEKYKDQGLQIVGIHTPEFEFEKEYDNVLRATEKFGVKYPVVLDNDYGTWTAYGNRYWPRKYLIDIDGYVVYDHIGEGAYEETELVIQKLLQERRESLGDDMIITGGTVSPDNVVERASDTQLTPEIYFGAWRNADFLAQGRVSAVGIQDFVFSEVRESNVFYLDGTWEIAYEFARSVSDDARVILPYQARDIFMVASADEQVRIDVTVDGKSLTSAQAGDDIIIDATGSYFMVHEDSLYRIVSDTAGAAAHILELNITEAGLRAFTFTFG